MLPDTPVQEDAADNMIIPGCASDPGSRYGDLQQDYSVVSELHSLGNDGAPQKKGWALAVLDGHGMRGETCAQIAGDTLLHEIKTHFANIQPSDAKNRENMVIKAFAAAHQAALQLYGAPPELYTYPIGSRDETEYSLTYTHGLPYYKSIHTGADRLLEFGTTCTLAVLQDQHLLIANVGDSSAVMGRRREHGGYTSMTLTVRHWGSNTHEAHRVMDAAGPRVKILPDGYISVDGGRFRGYQLAMSRALGHNMLADCGVISEPTISHHTLGPSDACLVIASDGVWDCYTALEAVEFCMEVAYDGGSAAVAAELLCSEAVERQKSGPGREADNTSAIVMFFDESCEENEQRSPNFG